MNYVEKPISIDELSSAIKQAVENIEKNRIHEKNMLRSLITQKQYKEEELLNRYGYTKINNYLILVLKTKQPIQNENEKIITSAFESLNILYCQKYIKIIYDVINPTNVVIYLMKMDNSADSLCDDFNKNIEEIIQNNSRMMYCFLGVGKWVSSLDQLKKSYEEASKALTYISFKGWNTFALSNEKNIVYSSDISDKDYEYFFKQLICKNQEASISFAIDVYKEFLNKCTLINFYVKKVYYKLNLQVVKAMSIVDGEENFEGDSRDDIINMTTLIEMNNYLIERITEYFNSCTHGNSNFHMVEKVINYIDNNLEKDVSIQVLADKVYLSSTYLSTIFKKQTGVTICQYITEKRINKAKEYLLNPRYKFYEIASLVGFNDANYFAKSFKKHTGFLPSQYRERGMK